MSTTTPMPTSHTSSPQATTGRYLLNTLSIWMVESNMLKPYQVKIWDYTTKSLIATLEGHTNNVSFACYHPELPIIISGSEDVSAIHISYLPLERGT